MTFAEWGVLVSIGATVLGGAVLAGRRLFARLDHLDACIDAARNETRSEAERVRTELLAEQRRVHQELTDHIRDEGPRLSAIDRTLAWLAGKMGLQPIE